MRIANIMAGAPAGGAELFFERLSAALAGAGEAVLPIVRRDPGREARLRAAGLTPVALGFGGLLDRVTGPRLRAALRAHAPRVAVAWMGRAARFAPRGDWVLVGRLGGYYDLGRFRRCDHLVGNTAGLARWIAAQGWPAARVHHLPNFVPDLLRPPAPVRGPGRTILAAGRLHRNKGFDLLVRALARLPGATLHLAGEGPERAALEALARAEGVADRVRMPGWSADLSAPLAACDVFVCCSRREPLGNVVLEAWSAARPLVAAAVAGPRELVRDGMDGLLVPPEDPAALAGAIARLLEDRALAARLAEAGRARWQAGFAPAPVLAAWRRFLAEAEKP